MEHNYNVSLSFLRTAVSLPDNIFLCGTGFSVSYREMNITVRSIASFLSRNRDIRRVGILGTRSVEAYAGVLAAGFLGATYVPLSPSWPEERLVRLLDILKLDALVVDPRSCSRLTTAVLDAASDLVIVGGDTNLKPVRDYQSITSLDNLDVSLCVEPIPVQPDSVAYILFTSGTTGHPKGVKISASALASYLDQARCWTTISPSDRIAETCDLTFDLTVHNLFCALRLEHHSISCLH